MPRHADWVAEGDRHYAAEMSLLARRSRRALRRGPRVAYVARPARPRGSEAGIGEASEAGGGLVEWHEMTAGQLIAEWAGLRAWVEWLTGRYELSVEERMPRCWARHPGLVEELQALRAWRGEIYGGQPGQGQAARYWLAELRTVVQAATTIYAAGCRTGHRGAGELAGLDPDVLREWGGAYPLAGVPAASIAAGAARGTDAWASQDEIADALDDGNAVPVPGSELVLRDGETWAPTAGGWVQVPDFPRSPGKQEPPASEGEDHPPWTR
jgi:hypothetical protein